MVTKYALGLPRVTANVAKNSSSNVSLQTAFFKRDRETFIETFFTAVSLRFQVRLHSYRVTGINFPRLYRLVETYWTHIVINLCTYEIYKNTHSLTE